MKQLSAIFFVLFCTFFSQRLQTQEIDWRFQDPELDFETRTEILVQQLTLEEKVSQLVHEAPAIERLNISSYNWWNEALHGVARSGYATVFPQSISVAASFDKDLLERIGTVTSDEARAKHHDFIRKGKRGIYTGLTFWSPNINIFRDPRWGRGHETYGEDPYLTGKLASSFIKGLQGDDPKYLKTIATSKHFAVHSGPESLRHGFDVDVSDVDLYETYLEAFRMTVVDANVQSIMSAYNRFRGAPASASSFLLDEMLRERWGFEGYVVSDCGAIGDILYNHKIVESKAEAARISLEGGCDLNCGSTYLSLLS
ncbi:MAG: glycoside hydrolase family 3 N-terminal domain-containing protein, partial [Flavobacteriaceae bacterium]